MNPTMLRPMLAHSFKKRGHNISWPAYCQPKMNGVRCLAEKTSATEVVYLSREGNKFETLIHLTPYILDVLEVGQVFDGELYSHGLTFQKIISIAVRDYE